MAGSSYMGEGVQDFWLAAEIFEHAAFLCGVSIALAEVTYQSRT